MEISEEQKKNIFKKLMMIFIDMVIIQLLF